MIDEFSSPAGNNPNKYLKVDENGNIVYLSPTDVSNDIINDNGQSGSIIIRDWQAQTDYTINNIVVYNNGFFRCIETHTSGDAIDLNKWQLLSGYFKKSKFFYDAENELLEVELDDTVPSKESLSVNINNLLLQSNNYDLDTDGKTIIFKEPIQPGNNIEVITYGNMMIPNDISEILFRTFTTTKETSEFSVGQQLPTKALITVNIDNTVIMQSEWDLNETLDGIILKNPVPADTRVQISWFNNVTLKITAMFTPSVNKEGRDTTISWTNDGDLPNPTTVHIYDGITYVPSQSKVGTETTISWTNDGEADNPENVVIKDGATFTPHITPIVDGYTLSWTNDVSLENPEPVNIMSGSGINPKGNWSAETIYNKGDYVIVEDDTATYGYIGLEYDIPAGTAVTDTTKWAEMYKISKTYIAATMIDWGE